MSDFNRIPSTPHYAIIREESVYIAEDERSREAPGHGYPAETRTYITYTSYMDRALWEAHIKSLTESRQRFRAISATPAVVNTTVTVTVTAPDHAGSA